jgi:hypothetical protein
MDQQETETYQSPYAPEPPIANRNIARGTFILMGSEIVVFRPKDIYEPGKNQQSFPVCAPCVYRLVLDHDHLHEVRALSKAPSIPMSLYFSHVFIVHKAMVKRRAL